MSSDSSPEHPVKKSRGNALYLLTLIGGAAMVGFAIWKVSGGADAATEHFGRQAPESALMMPKDGKPDTRFHFLSAWDVAQVPKAVRFDPPMGSEHGALVYNGQKYWEMNEKRGGHHTGDDLNGIGGMNTDLGDPVFSVADGLVVFAGEPSPGWGNIVVVAHKAPDGIPVHSMYAHLDRIEVAKDALVGRGTKIGTVGTANGYYPAHLHFEMRSTDGVDIGAGYAMQPFNRLDPMATVQSYRNSAVDALSPSALASSLVKSVAATK
jgi:hypothetical protein